MSTLQSRGYAVLRCRLRRHRCRHREVSCSAASNCPRLSCWLDQLSGTIWSECYGHERTAKSLSGLGRGIDARGYADVLCRFGHPLPSGYAQHHRREGGGYVPISGESTKVAEERHPSGQTELDQDQKQEVKELMCRDIPIPALQPRSHIAFVSVCIGVSGRELERGGDKYKFV